ncbi:MAG: histidinol-phosphatase [Fusicatenibacter sp.]
MKKTNFHTHYDRCRHADGSAEEYVQAALSAGMDQLGFSDHAPFPDYDFGYRMPFGELTDYIREMDQLSGKYRSDISLFKGLEIEYLPQYRDYYEDLLTRYGLDYLIMGEHFFPCGSGRMPSIYDIPSTDLYPVYARTIVEGMKTGYFAAIAHPDIYLFSPFAWDDNCRRAADILIDAAAATGTLLEYNANGLRRGKQNYPDGTRCPYPDERFWRMACQAPIRVIVGSDCHNPALLWDDAVTAAYRNLESLGITPTDTLFSASLPTLPGQLNGPRMHLR